MKTLKDVYRAAELANERDHLLRSAQSVFALACEESSRCHLRLTASGMSFAIKECKEQFKTLVQAELEAQRNKIDQELIAMGVDPHAEGNPASQDAAKASAEAEYDRVVKDTLTW